MSSPTKLKKRAEQVLPGSKSGGGNREKVGAGGRNGHTMYVHTNIYKYMNKEKKEEMGFRKFIC
jgi:hypothetical protein